jgi:hypothetical protein
VLFSRDSYASILSPFVTLAWNLGAIASRERAVYQVQVSFFNCLSAFVITHKAMRIYKCDYMYFHGNRGKHRLGKLQGKLSLQDLLAPCFLKNVSENMNNEYVCYSAFL